jgi:hypothetical protein
MQPIAMQFEDRTFRYTQVAREGNVAIYTQEHKLSGVIRFEVVTIRIAKEHTWPNGNVSPEREAYPGSSAWGILGRTFYTRAAAEAHMAQLQQSRGALLESSPELAEFGEEEEVEQVEQAN